MFDKAQQFTISPDNGYFSVPNTGTIWKRYTGRKFSTYKIIVGLNKISTGNFYI